VPDFRRSTAARCVVTTRGLLLTAPGTVEWGEVDLPEPAPGEARVRVAGCGLCHTDVTFFTGAVKTRHALPLVLGHEIAGVVEAAPPPYAGLVGASVIVPAVTPCGRCALCQAGRDTACSAQVMPGNDVHGGFAERVVVPAQHLVPVRVAPDGLTLAELAVVADAVTTPYQAVRRAGVAAGDLVVVIGVGGIGTYAVQIARAFGAAVAAVDIDEEKLARARTLGARWVYDARATDAKAIKRQLAAESGVATARWRILEMSGTKAGQELAWGLLGPAATLGVIGFTMEKPDIRLSNLMALDATAFGSWGCSPRHYPEVVGLVQSGCVQVRPFVECRPLAEGAAWLAAEADGRVPARRIVLVPEAG
jgi:6-hydroxycyclohex-1-ene-1-carbonyl-CoA dehydrogenase